MQATKKRLSLLKSKIIEVLPSGPDIFGFEGITKELLLETVAESYEIVTALDGYEQKFEAILLERKSSDYYDKAAKLLKDNFDEKKEEFNEFLNILFKIHFRIKEAYISIVKEPIRTESQLQKSKNDLLSFEEILMQLKPVYTEILEIKAKTDQFNSELKDTHSDVIEKATFIKSELEEIEVLKGESESSASQIATWEKNIKDLKDDISGKSVVYEELKTKIEVLKTDTLENFDSSRIMLSIYEKQVKENEKFQLEIQKTIEDANRHGMAGSFKKRKDELQWSLIIWGIATVASIVVLIFLSSRLLTELKKEDIEIGRILARLPIFASCVWLGWFCAKQYAVSMAFEGYKNSTKDIDPQLQFKLLEMTILNISINPISNYETTNNHGTPLNEIFKELFKKVTAKKKIGHVEAELTIEE